MKSLKSKFQMYFRVSIKLNALQALKAFFFSFVIFNKKKLGIPLATTHLLVVHTNHVITGLHPNFCEVPLLMNDVCHIIGTYL